MTWRVIEWQHGSGSDSVLVAMGDVGWPRYRVLVERMGGGIEGRVNITCGRQDSSAEDSNMDELQHFPNEALPALAWLLLRRDGATGKEIPSVFGAEGVTAERAVSVQQIIQTAVAMAEAGSYWVDGGDDWIVPWTDSWTTEGYVRASRREAAVLARGEVTLRAVLERFGVTAEHFTVEVVGYVGTDGVE